jgi:hypothetical protein
MGPHAASASPVVLLVVAEGLRTVLQRTQSKWGQAKAWPCHWSLAARSSRDLEWLGTLPSCPVPRSASASTAQQPPPPSVRLFTDVARWTASSQTRRLAGSRAANSGRCCSSRCLVTSCLAAQSRWKGSRLRHKRCSCEAFSFTCTDTSLHMSRMTAANLMNSYHTAGGSSANGVCIVGGSGVGAACCCSAAPAKWRLHFAAALWHMPAQCNRHAVAVWLAVSTWRRHRY